MLGLAPGWTGHGWSGIVVIELEAEPKVAVIAISSWAVDIACVVFVFFDEFFDGGAGHRLGYSWRC